MRALLVILAALVGCASVPEGPPPPSPEQSFQDVKAVALVRRVHWRGGEPAAGETRRRDPLDALQVALAERGVRTVTVELADRPPAGLANVDALARRAEWAAQSASPQPGGPGASSLGPQVAAVLGELGVDALAVYARGVAWGAAQPSPFFGQPLMAPPPAPVSAVGLLARDGTLITFAWGGAADPWGAAGPVNAAEAIDAALALLAPRAGE